MMSSKLHKRLNKQYYENNKKMIPLNFEGIRDDSSHPLSSLRSCSEYNRINLDGTDNGDKRLSDDSSWFASLFFWRTPKVTAEKFVESENRRRSRLFSDSIKIKPKCENVIPFTRAASIVPTPDRRTESDDSGYSLLSLYSKQSNSTQDYSTLSSVSRATEGSSLSFFGESVDILEAIFGLGSATSNRYPASTAPKKYPMEIELQELKPRMGLVSHRALYSTLPTDAGMNSSAPAPSAAAYSYPPAVVEDDDDDTPTPRPSLTGFPRVLSFRTNSSTSGGRSRADSITLSRNSSTSVAFSRTNSLTTNTSAVTIGDSASPDVASFVSIASILTSGAISFPTVLLLLIEKVHRIRHLLIDQRQDEAFYEAVRIQPFTSGSYLRGMLMGGLCNLFFHSAVLMYWPSLGVESSPEALLSQAPLSHVRVMEWGLYLWVCVMVTLHVIQLPIRVHIHLKCFASSRTVEVDNAVATLRALFVSDAWLINRALGWVIDYISVSGIVMGELYRYWLYFYRDSAAADPLSSLICSITSTIILAFAIRLSIAIVFCFSMHDPQVLAEARRRGLSKWDLETLPTFVFTRLEEVNNPDGCSICLSTFCMGEMLISLPCDKRHSFHANCIRQWLHRQNSCPLCQKHV